MCESRKVLIVDDDDQLLFGTRRRLEAAGYVTCVASDGDEGVRTASDELPDLVLMDVRMPRLDGLAALAQLRNNPATKDIPVVMLSASLSDQGTALDLGARYFVRKPYSGQQLLTAVEHAIRHACDASAPADV